jgi:hypothetical protein
VGVAHALLYRGMAAKARMCCVGKSCKLFREPHASFALAMAFDSLNA